jgi:hypothetical protein
MNKFDEALDFLNRGTRALYINEKFDEALELLDNGCDGQEAFDTYKKALEYGKKLEILLELYRDYFFVVEHKYNLSNSENIKTELAVRIKELEKEIEK